MTTTQQAAERALVTFLAERAGDTVTIEPDLDLIDSRILTSMAFMNFILLIEELTETPITLEDANLSDFRTLRAIRRCYLSALPSELVMSQQNTGETSV